MNKFEFFALTFMEQINEMCHRNVRGTNSNNRTDRTLMLSRNKIRSMVSDNSFKSSTSAQNSSDLAGVSFFNN